MNPKDLAECIQQINFMIRSGICVTTPDKEALCLACDILSKVQAGELVEISNDKQIIDMSWKFWLQGILDKYHSCDNPNCGKGAICNYCALKLDMGRALVGRIPKQEKECPLQSNRSECAIQIIRLECDKECNKCNGSGKVPYTTASVVPLDCSFCNGSGHITKPSEAKGE